MTRFPTQDLSQRLLQNGGRVPYGLFRPNVYRAGRRRGPPPTDDPIARLVAELRAMLRNLTNLNVRQPSHMAPPFRSEQWTHQVLHQGVATVTETDIPFNGNTLVPSGTRTVLTHVVHCATSGYNSGVTTPTWGEGGGTPASIKVFRNGQPIPGLDEIRPIVSNGAQLNFGANYATIWTLLPPLPIVPVTMSPGDRLSYNVTGTGVSDHYLQFAGYLYPVEVEADGVRGTLADRG